MQAVQEHTTTVALLGHLGESGPDGLRRLYKDPAVELYVAVRAEDILDEEPAGEETVIWVRGDASLVWHEVMPASSFAPGQKPPREGYRWPRP
jgi:hypothetical protein